jgi:hypothetical protein
MTPLNLTPIVGTCKTHTEKDILERYHEIIFKMMNILAQYTICCVLYHPVLLIYSGIITEKGNLVNSERYFNVIDLMNITGYQ